MKILHIHWRYDGFGGGEIYLHDLCNSLGEKGHAVSVMSSRQMNDNADENGRLDLIENSFGIVSGLRMQGRVQEIVRKRSPDIVHLHETLGFLSPLIEKRLLAERPVVQTLHTAFFFCPLSTKILPSGDQCRYPMGMACVLNGCLRHCSRRLALNMLWRKWVTRMVDRVVVPSRCIAEEAITNGVPADKITVIPLFTNKNSGNEYTKPKEKNILFAARQDPLKGITALLSALHLIKGEQWSACIIGGGSKAEGLAAELGISGRIEFLANVPHAELDTYYRRASILVFPSISTESFGLVGIEAMSFGRPVVAFDAGGPTEWLTNNETGLLVERGNIHKLAEAIKILLRDDSLASRMGKTAMKRVAQRFRKDFHMNELVNTYEGVLNVRFPFRAPVPE